MMADQQLPSMSNHFAMVVHCPLCKAAPREPCTYVAPHEPRPIDSHSLARIALWERVGKPTKRVHNARKREYNDRTRIGYLERNAKQLRDWLLLYGDILRDK